MLAHRFLGMALAAAGLALLFGQLSLLYGSSGQELLMVHIGLPGVAILSSAGAIAFAVGCLLAAAPRATVHHVTRVATMASRPLSGRRK